MLNYRHVSHAGNFGDVIKHIVLVEILDYLVQQDEALEYIDTHAGIGLYQLETVTTAGVDGASKAITALKAEDWPELARYFDIVHSFNVNGSINIYPGSPLIAKQLMRRQDRAWLYELNPVEFELLHNNFSGHDERFSLRQEDGFMCLPGLLPPSSGSGLILIDPPYESESEYDTAFDTILDAHSKFASGIYALWYPVVDRQRITQLQERFVNSGIANIQQFELCINTDTSDTDMTASGVIVINPPPELKSKMDVILPRLAETLSKNEEACCKCEVLAAK